MDGPERDRGDDDADGDGYGDLNSEIVYACGTPTNLSQTHDDCNDGNPCTDDVCDGEGGCGAVANTDPCDDGLFCNGAESCSATQTTTVRPIWAIRNVLLLRISAISGPPRADGRASQRRACSGLPARALRTRAGSA